MAARILVIEDNEPNLELMSYLLQAFGHMPLTVRDGAKALQAVLREAPDLILCDIQLPGIDGFEVARRLNEHPDLGTIPRVAITAMAMVGDRERLLAAGFDGYLAKPIDPETFVQQVEAFLPVQQRSIPPPIPARAAALPPIAAAPPMRGMILVVDDSSANLEVFRCTLEPFGFVVIATEDAERGLALALQCLPDLIVSDLHMHGQSGFDFLESVKSDPRLRPIPFILFTSSIGQVSDETRGLELGAVQFTSRPIDSEALVKMVDSFSHVRKG
jgi:two-component system cell cycle response regulator